MMSEVYNEDVFETMKRIETGSINLIICDSPYFKICGGFDWAFKTMQEWIDWHILLRDEFERIMADNGSLFVFGDEKNIAYLQVEFDKKFNLLNSIVYRKNITPAIKGLEGCNSFVPMTERILFYDKGENKTGLEMIMNGQNNFETIRNYFKDEREKTELSYKEINDKCFGSASNGGGMASNILTSYKLGWSFPTQDRYEALQKIGICQKPYEDLRKEYEDLRKEYEDLRKEYEDLRRPFNNQFRLTDVIDAKRKSSFHPTTKDGAVIEKLILTTTKENDLIFSPFLGSGTDRIAAHNTKRQIISCELDKNYYDQAEARYQEHIKQGRLF
jgi:adenine-specific DNA-methyltransferase